MKKNKVYYNKLFQILNNSGHPDLSFYLMYEAPGSKIMLEIIIIDKISSVLFLN